MSTIAILFNQVAFLHNQNCVKEGLPPSPDVIVQRTKVAPEAHRDSESQFFLHTLPNEPVMPIPVQAFAKAHFERHNVAGGAPPIVYSCLGIKSIERDPSDLRLFTITWARV